MQVTLSQFSGSGMKDMDDGSLILPKFSVGVENLKYEFSTLLIARKLPIDVSTYWIHDLMFMLINEYDGVLCF